MTATMTMTATATATATATMTMTATATKKINFFLKKCRTYFYAPARKPV